MCFTSVNNKMREIYQTGPEQVWNTQARCISKWHSNCSKCSSISFLTLHLWPHGELPMNNYWRKRRNQPTSADYGSSKEKRIASSLQPHSVVASKSEKLSGGQNFKQHIQFSSLFGKRWPAVRIYMNHEHLIGWPSGQMLKKIKT